MLLSDDRLTRRAVGGDERAFTAIFERYHEPLYRYCLAILGNREDAEDALQGTMLKVLRALPGERRRIELRPWLYRIAHNESIELIRRRRPGEPLDPELVARDIGPAEEASQRLRLRQLLSDLERLPARQRGAVVMRELGGLGFEEIAVALDTSPAVARQALYEARLGLREMDAGREMGCGAAMRAISDGDGRVLRRRDIRAHLRDCGACRRFREEIESRERDLAALSPLPAVAAATLLQGLLGGSGASGGAAGAALGAGAAKTAGVSALVKGAATVAVVAAIGVTAADRSGVIHVGLPGDGAQRPRSSQPAATSAGMAPATGGSPSSAPQPATAGGAPKQGVDQAVPPGVAKSAKATTASPTGPTADDVSTQQQPPGAPSHGQPAAAAHKTSGHGHRPAARASHPMKPPHSARGAHPTHPAKPAHPTRPAHPAHPAHPDHPARPPQASSATSPAPAAGQAEAAKKAKPESSGVEESP
jgi:RNA polymerase sigma factor (sigma-70 family)